MTTKLHEHWPLDDAAVARFWQKVDVRGDGECWLWLAARHPQGYGSFRLPWGHVRAHRLALSLSLGRPVGADLMALHTCDMPSCCNPAHLREGTALDNKRDEQVRGRTLRGERSPTATIPDTLVATIRELAAAGETRVAISEATDVSVSQVSAIIRGLARADGPGPVNPTNRRIRTPAKEAIVQRLLPLRDQLTTDEWDAAAAEYGCTRSALRRAVRNAAPVVVAEPMRDVTVDQVLRDWDLPAVVV